MISLSITNIDYYQYTIMEYLIDKLLYIYNIYIYTYDGITVYKYWVNMLH